MLLNNTFVKKIENLFVTKNKNKNKKNGTKSKRTGSIDDGFRIYRINGH
jgi:hypothetical protein